MSEVSERVACLLLPISETEAAGRDARHEAEHERVRAEVAKLGSLSGEPVDWKGVIQLGGVLLSQKAKDLAVATYVAAALQEQTGLVGLSEGLSLLVGMIRGFGGQLYPLRARARANAIEWFVERAARHLDQAPATEREQVKALQSQLAELSESLHDLLGADAPSVSAMRYALERMLLSAPPEASQAVAGAAVGQPSSASDSKEIPRAGNVSDALGAAQAWLQPISESAPAGQDLTYSDSAALLRAEMSKLEGLSGERPRWQVVFEECDRLLRTESKDLAIAAQFAHALVELSGWRGLELGLSLLSQLLDGYWLSLFPPVNRLRRRANALTAYVERVVPLLASISGGGEEPATFDRLDGAAALLQSTLTQRFGADAPSLEALMDALREARRLASPADKREVPSTAPVASAPAPAPAGHVGAALSPLPEATRAPQGVAEVYGYLEQTSLGLLQVAAMLRKAEPLSPLAARLSRLGLWLDLLEPPVGDGQRKTRIPAPDARVRKWLPEFVLAGNWAPVLEQTEGMLGQAPFWLDLHYYAAQAYSGLGGKGAAEAVLAETRKLVERMPALLELRFADDTPFASPDTLSWLSPPTGVGGPEAAQGPALDGELLSTLMRGEAEAIQRFEALLLSGRSARERFALRLELAEAMLRFGRIEQAIYACTDLKREVDEYHLERWDPALSLRVIETLCAAFARQGTPNGVVHPEWLDARARLGRLRPSALLFA